VLEDAVAPPPGWNLPAALESALVKGPIKDEVRTAMNGVGAAVSAAAVVSARIPGKNGDFWVIHDEQATYRLTKSGVILVDLLRQTHGSAEERAAQPEYVNAQAYNTLKTAPYPQTLPFDLFTESSLAWHRSKRS
jgi:hypothetical protein